MARSAKKVAGLGAAGIIASERDIADGVAALRQACPIMRRVHEVAGDPPLRRQAAGFEGLARIIVAQQLSTASAAAIWKRVSERIVPLSADRLLSESEPGMRAAGLSGPKIRTLRAVSEAVANGQLDLDRLEALDDAGVHAELCTVKGIGPWTADIYIMFSLGRADAFAAGDLALQVAAQHAGRLKSRPTPDKLERLAERWRPWRGVAARLLWAYYPYMRRAGGRDVTSKDPV